ncbi:hydrolase [Salinarimonas soli]|uniref:Hydrolase n=1 Tax=Salinarimonas soli TaxID=1638099 RepID=A0A5B2VD83_9HYPH|nr:hydrolase [Salinarimonas soli]KAA2236057.1 hydrolase [Salinarimonas soli]
MRFSRRHLLQAAALAPFLNAPLPRPAGAQEARAGEARGGPLPPILFLHGNGDHAALWLTTLWRFESNGVPRDRLTALNFTDPLARTTDAEPQAGRSSTEDQARELAEAIRAVRERTGAARVALVGNSRGGYPIRNHVSLKGGAAEVSHAVLCGTPNRGVYAWEQNPGGEFNGRGPFLARLNGGDTDVVPGTAFLTLRSERNDKFAQPDGRLLGRAGVPTGISFDGPELRGATNLVLGELDHREAAYHPRAFREMFRFIAGREPDRLDIVPEETVTLDGLVTGVAGGVPSNRPVADASVEVHRVDPATGERIGEAVHRRTTGADGRWGPVRVEPSWALEFVLALPGHPTTHIYRSAFPRSSDVVHLRPGRALGAADAGAGAVVLMTRPRGYFGIPRDVVLLDGREAADVTRGVPTDATTTVRLPAAEAGRAVAGVFNLERIVARAWPAAENRITIAELTY